MELKEVFMPRILRKSMRALLIMALQDAVITPLRVLIRQEAGH